MKNESSNQGSKQSSRAVTPVISRQQTPVIVKTVKKYKKLIIYLYFGFFIFLSLICCGNYEFSTYCNNDGGLFCKACPKHAECLGKYFKCQPRYKKYLQGCYHIQNTNLSELEESVNEYILSHNEWNYENILIAFPNNTKAELKAVITGNGKMQIHNSKIIPVFRFPNWVSIVLLILSIAAMVSYFEFKNRKVHQRRVRFDRKRRD